MTDAAKGQPMSETPIQVPESWPRRWRWGMAVAALVMAVVVFVWWRSVASAVPEVQVETMAPGPVTLVLAVSGKVAAHNQVQIRSAVSGTLLEVSVAEGAVVAAGDVLARLDPSQQEASVRQAASALGQGQVMQAQAAATYARNVELGNLVARSKLEDAKRALDGADQDVARLAALLDQATIQLARYTLRAPMAGTVTTRSVDPGQLVDPATTLFTLADLSVLVVETDVDEAYATRIALGQVAVLQLVGSRETLEGSVVFVSPRVDPASGGLAVKIGFDQPLQAPVGLTVTANVVVSNQQALTVPRTALRGDAVFVLKDGKAVLTPVVVTDWPAARLIVTEGLAAGDRVIVDSTDMTDGLAVKEAP
jgi:RND family efflux transporter MFP subunit